MLSEALLEGENADFREVQFILGRLSALVKTELIPTVLANLERLYPVAKSVASFFKAFNDFQEEGQSDAGDALLAPILNSSEARPSEYYSIWILSIFHHHASWGHAEDLLKIFRETSSDVVRRFAALGLARCGTRAQALAIKERLAAGSSLCRTAMLLATAKLGKDERKHFSKSLLLDDSLEKLCAATPI
jgi:hypothetical protein